MPEPTPPDLTPMLPKNDFHYHSARRTIEHILAQSYVGGKSLSPDERTLQSFLERQTYESRLLKPATYHYPGYRNEPPEPEVHSRPVAMYQRNSFIDEVLTDIASRDQSTSRMCVLVADIGNLRDADLAKAGDVLLGHVAHSISGAASELNEQLGQRGIRLHVGRYGGDEFVFSLTGNYSNQDVQLVSNKLKTAVTSLHGYFKFDETITRKLPVTLKNDSIEMTNIDMNDPLEKELYLYHMSHGLLLDRREIDREKDKFASIEAFHAFARRNHAGFEYPEGIHTVEEKERYLVSNHPEFAEYFRIASQIRSGQDANVLRSSLVTFIENVVADRLLGAAVTSFSDVSEHIRQGQISEVHMIDCKFIKEINDRYGYVDADRLIRSVWDEIKRNLASDDWKKVIIARKGGTFVLAVKKGEVVDPQSLARIKQIGEITAPDQFELSLPIGHSVVDVAEFSNKQMGKIDQKDILREAEKQAEDNLFVEVIKRMKSLSYQDILPYENEDTDLPNGFSQLIQDLLRGNKRSFERLSRFTYLIQNRPELSGDEYRDMRKRFIYHFERARDKKKERYGIEENK